MATTFYQFSGLDNYNGVIYTVTIATYNGGGDGPSVSETVQTIGECEYTQDNLVWDIIEKLVCLLFF